MSDYNSRQTIPVDLSDLLTALRGNLSILDKIIEHLKISSRKQLDLMHQAIMEQDFELLKKTAHTMKGSLSNFGPSKAVELAITLETSGKAGNLSGASDTYDALCDEVDKILAYFNREDWKKDWL
jgi:HPt (histidine-containing phosphotransfer) domain-containing protein